MTEEASQAAHVLGPEGRMISASKTGFRERHPDHAAIFNANVCIRGGKIWHGDLDLTVDEPRLIALAEQLGLTVFVLYERDGRFENEREPLLDQAVYRAFTDGQTAFDQRSFRRGDDATLRRVIAVERSSPTLVTPLDWDGSRRWRALRFWRLDLVTNRDLPGRRRSHLLYVGERGGASPLLVLGLHRERARCCVLTFEITWYPSRRPHLSQPSIKLERRISIGRIEIVLWLQLWRGHVHEAQIRFALTEES